MQLLSNDKKAKKCYTACKCIAILGGCRFFQSDGRTLRVSIVPKKTIKKTIENDFSKEKRTKKEKKRKQCVGGTMIIPCSPLTAHRTTSTL